jgi:GAF domain-containing protein/HAMP domain-containing protein
VRLVAAARPPWTSVIKVFPDNAEIFITDVHGGLAAATNRTSDYNQADEAWWQAAYNYGQGAIYISNPEFDASANTLGIQVALPLRDRASGNVIGILRTTYIMRPLTNILKQDIGENSAADILIPGISGETVIQIREGALGTMDSQLFKQLQAVASQGMAEMDYQGTPSVISQAVIQSRDENQTIKNLGWIVVFHQSQDKAFAPVNAQIRGIIIVIAIVIFLGVLAAIFVAQVLVKPLTQLTNTAQEITAGNLNSQVQVTSSDEIGILASTFNSMTAQLRDFIGLLEQRVTDRTHDLELAAEVGSTIAEKVENITVMLTDATEMIRSNFNLYYTQVYLLDPSGQTITLRAGTGDAGKQLLQRGHHLLVNSSSLNGRAVSEKRPIIVADTQKSGTFLPNPLLPNTRSEMAIPLLVGDKVLGVLDMQSEIPEALNEDNVAAFQVLAGQLSVAIQNATLYAQSENTRKQMEANARQITTSGWQDFLNGNDRGEKIGYVFDQNEVKPMERKSKAISNNILSMPITVTGATVGSIEVAQDERKWTTSETEIIQSTAEKLSQHIEGLRLLAQAEKYRQEAEQNTRRLTREGWEDYLQTRSSLTTGYTFIPNEIKVENDEMVIDPASALNLPLKVRDETVGELVIQGLGGSNDSESISLANAVVERLGAHIEALRLSSQTEQALAATQEFAQREQSLRQITSAVRGSTDPATILRTAARELGTLLGRKTIIRLAATAENAEPKTIEDNGNELVSPADKPISAVGGN